MKREKQFMDDKVWDVILNDYIATYRHINCFSPPTFLGHKDTEPLIDRKLPTRLRGLADVCPDMKIDIYSNGVLLPKWRDRGQDFMEFLATLPNKVRYLMSYHPKNYDNSANDYAETILYLQEVLQDRKPPNVEFITVSHKSKWVSERDQEWWQRTWENYPITVHSNCSINPWTGRIDEATCEYHGCPYSDFGHWFFGVTGNIIACCLDLEEEIVLGNVLTDSPVEMFNKTQEFYAEQRRILEAKELHPRGVCRNCFGQKRDEAELITLGVSAG